MAQMASLLWSAGAPLHSSPPVRSDAVEPWPVPPLERLPWSDASGADATFLVYISLLVSIGAAETWWMGPIGGCGVRRRGWRAGR